MSLRPLISATASRRRSWSIFWAVSAAAVGTCFIATLRSSGTTSAGLVLVGGFIVVGVAAALMYSIVSPFPDQLESRHGMGDGFDGGGGDFGGGDFGGGDAGS